MNEIEKAIDLLAPHIGNDCYTQEFQKACANAVTALREKLEREKNKAAMRRLFNGEWVETREVCKSLGITFADGFQAFDFSRTAEWWSIVGKTDEERAREGQRITTFFRLKMAMPGEEV